MILVGDVLEQLRKIPDNTVHCVVTSPPYWGLRDYGVDGQIGLEPTMQEYIGKMVDVFREVKRVLRADGVCFVNLGDSYLAQQSKGFNGQKRLDDSNRNITVARPKGLKPKDLCGIPWRVALALQENGWWLRSDIIWNKPNPMPESVTDRPTKSHEYIFLLTKSSRYFWDQEATREVAQNRPFNPAMKTIRPNDTSWHDNRYAPGASGYGNHPSGRNLRTVWTIPTESFSQAHFATYPQKLVETCIKAGTSEWGCCPECGKAWGRVVEKGELINVSHCKTTPTGSQKGSKFIDGERTGGAGWTMDGKFISGWQKNTKTLGFQPSCTCQPAEPIPCTVLDPFLGSGTTAMVAQKMGRHWIGIELNPEYAAMAKKRLGTNLFAEKVDTKCLQF